MSLWKPNFNKEGKGIEKDEYQGNFFERYSKIYYTNFFKLVRINAVYFLASIPVIALLVVLFALFLYPYTTPLIASMLEGVETTKQLQTEATYISVFMVLFVSEMFVIFGAGPASAYFSYGVKCVINDIHLWYFDDLKKIVRENLVKGIIVWLIALIFSACAIIAIISYIFLYKSTGNILFLALFVAISLIYMIFILMHGIIYQLMITLDANLITIYKNAFVLALAKMPQLLFFTALAFVLTALLFSMVSPMVSIVLTAFLWIAVMRFPIEYIVERTIDKLIKNNEGQE